MGGVLDGQQVSAAVTNPAFLDANGDDIALGIIGFHSTAPASGANIDNIQRVGNRLMTATGVTENSNDGMTYGAPASTILNGDNHPAALLKLANKFDPTTGHKHTGSAGDGARVIASDLTSVPLKGYIQQGSDLTSITGTSTVVTTQMSGKTNSAGTTSLGVVVIAPENKIVIRQATGASQDDVYVDGSGNIVYGRLTFATSVWTLSFFVNLSGTETAFSFTANNIRWYYQELYNPMVSPPVYSEFASIPSDNATADVIDATSSLRGLISAGTQSLGGIKTFVDTTASTTSANGAVVVGGGVGVGGAINSGSDIKTGTKFNATGFGGVAKALASNVGKDIVEATTTFAELNLVSGVTSAIQTQLNAKATDSLVVHLAGAETVTGAKIFNDLAITGALKLTEQNNTQAGTALTISNTRVVVHLTGAVVSIAGVTNLLDSLIIIENLTGASFSVLNENAGAAANDRIITGTGADITVANNQSLLVYYCSLQSRWRVIGGTGSGSGSGVGAMVTKTANYTVLSTDNGAMILVDATSGAFSITLTGVTSISGFEITIKKIDDTVNAVTLQTTASFPEFNQGTSVLKNLWESYTIKSTGAAWYIK